MNKKTSGLALSVTALYCLLTLSIAQSNPPPAQNYTNKLQLGKTVDTFVVYWSQNSTHITFELHVHNTTWLLFGFQNTSTMQSDAVLAWLNTDRTGYFANVVLNNSKLGNSPNYQYTVNTDQNWIPLNALIYNNYLCVQMIRPIKLQQCSQYSASNNVDLVTGSIPITFATGITVDLFALTVTIQSVNTTNANVLNDTQGPYSCATPPQIATFGSTPTQAYSNYMDLADGGNYRLYWNYNDTTFVGEVHVRTLGWVGFGFSPNGNMPSSNVMIFYVDSNGVANFTERYTNGPTDARGVTLSAAQNWKLVTWKQANGYTVVKFQRPIVLCGEHEITISVCSYNYSNELFLVFIK
jgi:hypothetical protein